MRLKFLEREIGELKSERETSQRVTTHNSQVLFVFLKISYIEFLFFLLLEEKDLIVCFAPSRASDGLLFWFWYAAVLWIKAVENLQFTGVRNQK